MTDEEFQELSSRPVTRGEMFNILGMTHRAFMGHSLVEAALIEGDIELARSMAEHAINFSSKLNDAMRDLAGIPRGDTDGGE